VSLYQLSRNLPEYVEAFRYLDRAKAAVNLDQILKLHSSAIFQGSGLDAPSIKRTLGLGACFVARELTRLGVLQSSYVHSHCFVPVQRVRNRFVELGCHLEEMPAFEQSAQIYNFLRTHLDEKQATFNNSFDIPFQVIHREWGRIPSDLCVYNK
jgi:hypothetical protein